MTTRLLFKCKTIKPTCNICLLRHKIISVILNRYNINDTNLFIDDINKNQEYIKENILKLDELCVGNFHEYNSNNKFDTITDEYIKDTIYSYLNKKEIINIKDILDNKTSINQFIYLQFLAKLFEIETYYSHLCQCNNELIKSIIIKLENEHKNEINNNDIEIFNVKIKEGYDDYINTGIIPDFMTQNISSVFNAIPINEFIKYLFLSKKDNLIDTLNNGVSYYLYFDYNRYIEDKTEETINKYKKLIEDINDLKTLKSNYSLLKNIDNIKNYVSFEVY